MKTLTINQKVFKHQDTQTKLKISLFENDSRVSLDSNSEYQFKIKNASGYLKSETLTIEDDRLVLTTDKFKDLTPDTYNFEVWVDEDSIYPSDSYGYFKITKNVSEVDGKVIPVITIEDFEKRFAEAVKNAKGDKGDTGERGPQGLQGPVGPQGPKGEKGDTGLQGEKGEKGDTGPQGLQGPVGPQGPKGERGEVGPKGEKGDTGLQGEKGDKGDTGERGADGKDGTNGVDGKNGQDGKSAYQIWLDLGNSGSEQDFINSLKAQNERHAPTGYTLDTSTKPWTLLFDNGCRIVDIWHWNNGAIFRPDPANQRGKGVFPVYSIPDTIMKVITGNILYSDFKNSNWGGGFFDLETKVENPINNGDKYNWDGTKIMKDGTSPRNRAIFARVIYELGIWSDEIVEELGAVRKAGN